MSLWFFRGCMPTGVTTQDEWQWNLANESNTWMSDWRLDSRSIIYTPHCAHAQTITYLTISRITSEWEYLPRLLNITTNISRDIWGHSSRKHSKLTVCHMSMVTWLNRQWVEACLATLRNCRKDEGAPRWYFQESPTSPGAIGGVCYLSSSAAVLVCHLNYSPTSPLLYVPASVWTECAHSLVANRATSLQSRQLIKGWKNLP